MEGQDSNKPQHGSEAAVKAAYRDDMGDSYGAAYTTRSSDEGYGESYGEAAKAVMEKKAQKEDGLSVMQRGATAERDTSADAGVHVDYDRTQGHPVAQKEHSRHATMHSGIEDETVGHRRSDEMGEGGRGGAAT